MTIALFGLAMTLMFALGVFAAYIVHRRVLKRRVNGRIRGL